MPHLLSAAAKLAPIKMKLTAEERNCQTPGRILAAVDCTYHLKRREGSNDRRCKFYRGDKDGMFFVGVEAFVSVVNVRLLSVKVVLGHNNDAGTLKYFGTGDALRRQNINWAGDLAYVNYANLNNFGPLDPRLSSSNQKVVRMLRSSAEHPFSHVKQFQAADSKFRGSFAQQVTALLVIYYLVQYKFVNDFRMRELKYWRAEHELPEKFRDFLSTIKI